MAKYECRGKYSGVKAHFDEKECQELLDFLKLYKSGNAGSTVDGSIPLKFTLAVAKGIKDILKEHPDMLKERTPEQILEALNRDKTKIEAQLQVIKKKGDWKKVK